MIGHHIRCTFGFVAAFLVLAACEAGPKTESSSPSESTSRELRPKGLTINIVPETGGVTVGLMLSEAETEQLEQLSAGYGVACFHERVEACLDFLKRVRSNGNLMAALNFARSQKMSVYLGDKWGRGSASNYVIVDPAASDQAIIDSLSRKSP
jgi:hypothetical protein